MLKLIIALVLGLGLISVPALAAQQEKRHSKPVMKKQAKIKQGSLIITVEPSDVTAKVWIDNQFAGAVTKIREFLVPYGSHKIKVQARGYQPYLDKVDVREKGRMLVVQLEP